MADEGRPTQPSAAEVGGLVEAEKLAISMGWLDQCDYVGIGRCVRMTEHDLPHVTDPTMKE